MFRNSISNSNCWILILAYLFFFGERPCKIGTRLLQNRTSPLVAPSFCTGLSCLSKSRNILTSMVSTAIPKSAFPLADLTSFPGGGVNSQGEDACRFGIILGVHETSGSITSTVTKMPLGLSKSCITCGTVGIVMLLSVS